MLEMIVPIILTKKTIKERSIIQSRLNKVPRKNIPIAKRLAAIGIHQMVKYFFICRRVCFIQISHNYINIRTFVYPVFNITTNIRIFQYRWKQNVCLYSIQSLAPNWNPLNTYLIKFQEMNKLQTNSKVLFILPNQNFQGAETILLQQ